MAIQDLKQNIHNALGKLKGDEVRLENDYSVKWGNGIATFDLLPNLVSIRNKRAKLKTALKIIEEYA